jgi:hypothetical protein
MLKTIPVGESSSSEDIFTPEVFVERLHRLGERGYQARIGSPETGAVTLRHPGKAPPLLLWTDGLAVSDSLAGIRNDVCVVITPDDKAAFERFAATVPLPTARQRFADLRVGEIGVVLLLTMCAGNFVLIVAAGVLCAVRLLWT